MIITIGRGRNRMTTEVATGPNTPRAEREQNAWDLKRILFARGIIKSLG